MSRAQRSEALDCSLSSYGDFRTGSIESIYETNTSSPESFSYSPSPSIPSSASPSPYPSTLNLPNGLPTPGSVDIPDQSEGPKKKSHARKQSPGHVPRPRNAFILFRCDVVKQKRIPQTVERDHRNISRIVGKIWREMGEEERAPWTLLAEREKARHASLHPGYRYNPIGASSAPRSHSLRKRRGRAQTDGADKANTTFTPSLDIRAQRRRSSSCPPPGSAPVIQISESLQDAPGIPVGTRDDLSRRPSATTMYSTSAAKSSSPSSSDVSAVWLAKNAHWNTGPPGPPLISSSHGRIARPAGEPWGWDESPQPYLWLSPEDQGTTDTDSAYSGPDFSLPIFSAEHYAAPSSSRTRQPSFPIFRNPFEEVSKPDTVAHKLPMTQNSSLTLNSWSIPPGVFSELDPYAESDYSFYDPSTEIGNAFPRLSLDDS